VKSWSRTQNSVVGDVYNNHATYSDRVLYGRRHTPTRERVNWSRGAASRGDSPIGPDPDDTVAPDQTTSYNTSDHQNADPDSPAPDGQGSRHNYTAIGNVPLTYDNNRGRRVTQSHLGLCGSVEVAGVGF
jgi:hypothetical protein